MDAETMEAIEKWAADEFRSTNGQLQWIIAEALRKSGRMKKKKTIIKKEEKDRKSTRLNSSHPPESRMPSSA